MGDGVGWDTHRDNFPRTKALSLECDTAMAALVEDLQQRGLLDTTLVVWMGEFGRHAPVRRRRAQPLGSRVEHRPDRRRHQGRTGGRPYRPGRRRGRRPAHQRDRLPRHSVHHPRHRLHAEEPPAGRGPPDPDRRYQPRTSRFSRNCCSPTRGGVDRGCLDRGCLVWFLDRGCRTVGSRHPRSPEKRKTKNQPGIHGHENQARHPRSRKPKPGTHGHVVSRWAGRRKDPSEDT